MTVQEYLAGIPYDAMGDYSWLKESDAPAAEVKEQQPEK